MNEFLGAISVRNVQSLRVWPRSATMRKDFLNRMTGFRAPLLKPEEHSPTNLCTSRLSASWSHSRAFSCRLRREEDTDTSRSRYHHRKILRSVEEKSGSHRSKVKKFSTMSIQYIVRLLVGHDKPALHLVLGQAWAIRISLMNQIYWFETLRFHSCKRESKSLSCLQMLRYREQGLQRWSCYNYYASRSTRC